jgi:hypothetical protein
MLAVLAFNTQPSAPSPKAFFETGPEGLEGQQVEKKSKAAQTKPTKPIRRTCPSGHGSDGSGPKWLFFIQSHLILLVFKWGFFQATSPIQTRMVGL